MVVLNELLTVTANSVEDYQLKNNERKGKRKYSCLVELEICDEKLE